MRVLYLRWMSLLYCDRFLRVAATGFVGLATSAGAAIIDGYSAAANDRFADNEAFIASGLDLSGVAISDSGKWLTMVSPNVFITANHYKPTSGNLVTFYATNDPAGGSVRRTVGATSLSIGDTDLWLGTLSEPLPVGYGFYDFARQAITNTNTDANGKSAANSESFINSPYYLADAYLFGRSPVNYSVSQDMAVGRNRIDGFQVSRTVDTQGTGAALETALDDKTQTNYLTHELKFQSGDSGGPMFVGFEGNLVLVGINWYLLSAGETPVSNGLTYVGNYATAIDAFIIENTAATVPEPAQTALLLAAGSCVFVIRRRMRRIG